MFFKWSLALESIDILKFIGKPVSDKELANWLSISGNQAPSLEEGNYRAYLEYPEHGYCLTFTDEAIFLGIEQQFVGEGELYFCGVFFYSEGLDGYNQFCGDLPQNVLFEDDTKSLKIKLGAEEWNRHSDDGALVSERWSIGKFKFHITYNSAGTIEILSISKPEKA